MLGVFCRTLTQGIPVGGKCLVLLICVIRQEGFSFDFSFDRWRAVCIHTACGILLPENRVRNKTASSGRMLGFVH